MSAVLFWKGTTAAYEALTNKSDARIYFIEDTGLLYKGSVLFGNVKANGSITVDGTYTNIDVPTVAAVKSYVSGQLSTALASYDTSEQVTAKINSALSSVLVWKGVVATEADLPAADNKPGDLYYVTEGEAEFVWNGTEWEELGTTVDYSVFAQQADLTALQTKVSGITVNGQGFATDGNAINLDAADIKLGEGFVSPDGSLSNFTTETDLQSAIRTLDTNLATITGGSDPDGGSLAALASRVSTAEGDIDALQTAVGNVYTKTEVDGLIDGAEEYADQAELDAVAAAKAYTDTVLAWNYEPVEG